MSASDIQRASALFGRFVARKLVAGGGDAMRDGAIGQENEHER